MPFEPSPPSIPSTGGASQAEADFHPQIALDPNWYKRLKYELKWENLWHNGDYPNTYGRLNWVRAFGGAGYGCWCCGPRRRNPGAILSPRYWLLWRVFVCVYMVAVLVYSAVDAWGHGTWFYYLTNWQTLLFACYAVSALGTSAWIQLRYWQELTESRCMSDVRLGVTGRHRMYHLPWYCRITWTLHGLSMSLGTWVTFMFWSGIPMFIEDFDGTQIVDHITTMLVLVIDFSFAAFPWLLLQFVWSALVALAYLGWTIVHYELKLGNKFEDKDKHRIYPVIDWSHVGTTCLIVLPTMIICIPAFSFLIWILSSESVGGPHRLVPWGYVRDPFEETEESGAWFIDEDEFDDTGSLTDSLVSSIF